MRSLQLLGTVVLPRLREELSKKTLPTRSIRRLPRDPHAWAGDPPDDRHKSAIVTGGASGFAVAISTSLAEHGIDVLIADLDFDGSGAVASGINQARRRGHACAVPRCDVVDLDSVAAMVEAAFGQFGRIDILVNNAGVLTKGSALEDTTPEDFQRIFDVNCKGVFLGCRAVLPHFRAQSSGVIINIASGSVLRPRAGAVVYTASKGAVVALTRALAAEVAGAGPGVNAICPAISKTPLAAEFLGFPDDELWQEMAKGNSAWQAGAANRHRRCGCIPRFRMPPR